MIKVFLVDDHIMFREGLKNLIKRESEIKIVGEAEDGITALKMITTLKPDVAIVDISIPGLNGIELTSQIKKSVSDIEILILSMHSDAYFAVNAIKKGAKGYILKEDSFELLIDAIKTVAKSQISISPALSEFFMNKANENLYKKSDENYSKLNELLTEREIQILQLIAEGYTNAQIADKLFISSGTVDTHRKNLMKKLNIHNVSGLVKFAIKHKIISI